jgi:hypothetical protein
VVDTIEVNGSTFTLMQQSEARPFLGVSHKTFYVDAEKPRWNGPWKRETVAGGRVIYYVPNEYVEFRLQEKARRKAGIMEGEIVGESDSMEEVLVSEMGLSPETMKPHGSFFQIMERAFEEVRSYHQEAMGLAKEVSEFRYLTDRKQDALVALELENAQLRQQVIELEALRVENQRLTGQIEELKSQTAVNRKWPWQR